MKTANNSLTQKKHKEVVATIEGHSIKNELESK